jgi:hypothetical protein
MELSFGTDGWAYASLAGEGKPYGHRRVRVQRNGIVEIVGNVVGHPDFADVDWLLSAIRTAVEKEHRLAGKA